MTHKALEVLQLVPKYGQNDCVIASLASYLGKPYESVLIAAHHVVSRRETMRDVVRSGVEYKDALKVARRLGVPCRLTSAYDLDEDTGVLSITYNSGRAAHAVLLLEGRIVELEHAPITSWDASAYLKANNANAGLLLVRK